jgi:tetratricopeptide (TPR) repeat protein
MKKRRPIMFYLVSSKTHPRKVNVIRQRGSKGLSGLLLALTALVLSAGCAAPVIKVDVMVPGRFSEPAQLKSVAVLPFDGPDGLAYSSLLEARLAGIIINDKQYFQLVDRNALNKTLSEMKLGMTGIVDANKAAQVGKVVGARGIYTGIVNVSSVSDSPYTEKRSKCSNYVTKTNTKGETYKECVNTFEYTVRCFKRTATFNVTPKLIEVESSKIVYSSLLEGVATDSYCSDSERALKDNTTLKRAAQEQTAAKFRLDVAPYLTTVKISLMDSTSGIESAHAKDKLKSGMEFAKNNRLDRSCEIWSEALSSAPNSIAYLYNLGVCAEVKGRLEEAQSLYKQADKQLSKPDNKISSALSRVGAAIEKQKKLSTQMMSL